MPVHARGKRKSDQTDGARDEGHASTPTGSPARKRVKITQAQKQALIDNLQLEITERARHLRAHYALQSSDLRARIERRINRIPVSLRKANLGELLQKSAPTQSQSAREMPPGAEFNAPRLTATHVDVVAFPTQSHVQPVALSPSPPKFLSPTRPAPSASNQKTAARGQVINIACDKENEELEEPATMALPTLQNPKRVIKDSSVHKAHAARPLSRTAKQASVLSPRSHNSRTLPGSPIKEPVRPTSPTKPHQSLVAQPTSPLKLASPFKTAASAAGGAISASLHGMVEQAKRGAARTGLARTASREKVKAVTTTTTTTMSTTVMGPPPYAPARTRTAPLRGPSPASTTQHEDHNHNHEPLGPAAPAAIPLQRTFSQASQHSNSSAASTSTTVVTKKGKKTTAAAAVTAKSSTATAGVSRTKAAAPKKNATTHAATVGVVATGKKVVVAAAAAAEPTAAGRRVLRKRG